MKVYYWPNGDWYSEQDVDEMGGLEACLDGKSDDYAVMEVPDDHTDDEIGCIVQTTVD